MGGDGGGKMMVCRWVIWEVVDWRERGGMVGVA
jgi:hypothetical protein